MDKLRALTHHLIECLNLPAEQIDSWAEQVTLPLYWKPTAQGMHMGDMRYRAVLLIERFCGDPKRLMALVGAWLATHDATRVDEPLPLPVFELNPLDADLTHVELQLDFVEPQHLVESASGDFEAFGKRWAFVPFDLWTAEYGSVSHDHPRP